jgi:hypothetical protein
MPKREPSRVYYRNIPGKFMPERFMTRCKEVIIGARCLLSTAQKLGGLTDSYGDFWFKDCRRLYELTIHHKVMSISV